MKSFIFNADDLGLSRLTTKGVLECADIVRSASLMITSKTAEDAYKQAVSKGISVGLHLNVSGEGNFINQNQAFGKDGIVNKAYKKDESLPEGILTDVFLEFNAQLELFRDKFGTTPSHINFHHPLYRIPNFTNEFRQFIENVSLPTRWFKDLGEVKVLHPVYTEFRFFDRSQISIENLIKFMHEAPNGVTEFVLHPGLLDETLNSSYKSERQSQVDVLSDSRILVEVENNRWKLTNFDEIR